MEKIALALLLFILIATPIIQGVKTKNWWLNHRPLHEQAIFWAAINWSVGLALLLGFNVWREHQLQLDSTGYANFLEISKLPIGILGGGLALTAFITSLHRSIQTAKQIDDSSQQNIEKNYERILEAAKDCLEKSYELLNENGKIKTDELSWKNSAAFIAEFNLKKSKIKSKPMIEQLEVWEDYWRVKFEDLIKTLGHSISPYSIKTEPGIVFFIMTFSTWRKNREEIKSQPIDKDLINEYIKKIDIAEEVKRYLTYHKEKIKIHSLYMLISTPIQMPDPNKQFEDAVNGPASDDPAVRAEQERRGLVLTENSKR